MKPLENCHAVVTGGGRGIGERIAQELAAAGTRVTLVGRNKERLTAVALRLKATPRVLDVTDAEAVESAFNALGPVDVLVNNAGTGVTAPLMSTTPSQWNAVLSVNLTALFHTCRAVAPGMVQRGYGRIVNIVSTAGLMPYRDVAAYVTSKHGAIGLTRALALELATSGVTVNAVCPGYTDTDMFQQALHDVMLKTGRGVEEATRLLVRKNPQQRVIQPAEIAAAVLWLCQPAANSVTGQSVVIAGGELMH